MIRRFTFLFAMFVAVPLLAQERTAIIFAVDGYHKTLEPLAMLTGAGSCESGNVGLKYSQPPNDMKYYQSGRRYRVYSAGSTAGFATVSKPQRLGCNSPGAAVALTQDVDLGIAVVDIWRMTIKAHHDDMREPRKRELEAMGDLARRVYSIKGLAGAGKIQSTVLATDLDGDRKSDFLVTCSVMDSKFDHRLFFISMGGALKEHGAEYVWYYAAPRDEDGTIEITFFDQADFDCDGVDEVILLERGKESHNYRILKRRYTGEWITVYEGGGSGC